MGNRDCFDLLKELKILWIGAWPPALDIVNTQLVKLLGNPNFIFRRKRNVFGLRPIPESGIVEFNCFQLFRPMLPL